MKKTFAIPPISGLYLTKGKKYETKYTGGGFSGHLFEIEGDGGENLLCLECGCAHLNGRNWTFVEEEVKE